jgi:hypothetical protein
MGMPFRSFARRVEVFKKAWPKRTSYLNYVWGVDDSLPKAEGWLIAFSVIAWGMLGVGLLWLIWRMV